MCTVDMTKGSQTKLLIQFSIPILIGNLFQQVYTLADRIIVGRFVGDAAFSAIGATNALSMMFMSMCMGAAIGTGVIVSQYFGAKDEKGTAASIANGTYACILIAIATVLSETIAAVLCIIYAFRKVPQFKQAYEHRKINKDLMIKIIRVGIPTGLQYALIYVSSIVLQRIVNGFGESVIGAFTATTQIELLVQQIFAALGAAIVTYTGQNMGAGKYERISLGVVSAMKISAVISIVLLAVFWLFGKPIMSIFVTNAEIISIAATGIRITSLFLITLGGVQILRYMLNGAGDSMYALMNGVVEVIARVTFAISLTAIPFIGMWGIWLTTGLTWTVTAIFALFRYKHGAWKSKILI